MSYVEMMMSLTMLTGLEIILGIDNLVLLAVLTEKLSGAEQKQARKWGLLFAWVTRLLLLASAVWLTRLKQPVFSYDLWSFSIRDLFMLVGGFFLITKSTQEIHQVVLHAPPETSVGLKKKQHFWSVVIQIGLLDIIFSLDSVLTAIGLTNTFWIMAAAISIAIIMMLFASERVSRFIYHYPTLKMLAFCFLMLIGTVLIADGFSFAIPRGYVYFAMGFALAVETLNILSRRT